MLQNKIVRINSKLYFDLFQRGGDKLIAVYSILKVSREGEVKYYAYKSNNNKHVQGLNLLRAKTSLTLHLIEKYVPILIDMELCFIDSNGDFVLIGNKKLNEKYNCKKIVPIKIGRNMLETSYYAVSVRTHSAQKTQEKEIKKKLTRREHIRQGSDPKTNEDYKKAKKLIKRFGEKIEINEKTVLSNEGFCLLKQGEEKKNNIKFVKSNGTYWKKKLKSMGILTTKRQFIPIKKMSYLQYNFLKSQNVMQKNNVYRNGYLQEEIISSFKALDLVGEAQLSIIDKTIPVQPIISSKEVYKRKSYLQFDVIDFWINGTALS